jgi:nucleotide-binding universal stress UspA family protein
MRSILLHAEHNPAGENRLQTALDIARRFGGHLTAHINTPIGRLFAMDGFGGVYPLTELIAKAQVDAGALVSEMDARLARDDVPFTVERSEFEPADGLSASARLADLVVMDLDDLSKIARPQTSMVGAVALAGGAPVLALVRGKPLALDGTVMIAWNDSREAAAAVKAAVPLLALAKSVRVVRIERNDHDLQAESVLAYLSRHNIHAELKVADDGWLTIEEGLEHEAQALGADWIVMGAYGHSRIREILFGGVTRYLLESAQFPLFIAH